MRDTAMTARQPVPHVATSDGAWLCAHSHRGAVFVSILLTLAGSLILPFARAQSTVSEYHVKAGFLFHFAEMADWPSDALAGQSFNFCVIGDDPFHGELEATLEGKALGGRTIRIVHLSEPPHSSSDCPVLFIGPSEGQRLTAIFKEVGSAPVMSVGETDDFIEKGGMIRFCLDDSRVRFEVNLKAADRAR